MAREGYGGRRWPMEEGGVSYAARARVIYSEYIRKVEADADRVSVEG